MRKSTNQGRFKRKVDEVEKDVPEEPVEENSPTKKSKLAHKRGKNPENSETLPEKVEVVAEVPKKKSKRNAKDETVIVEDPANSKKATKSKKKKQEDLPVVEPKEEKEVETPKKNKQSKTVNNDTMNSTVANSTVADEEYQEDDESDRKVNKFETTTMDLTLSAGFPDDWNKEERCLLLEQVQSQLPEDDVKEYNKTLRKINWDVVMVTGRSSEECKAEYHGILRKLKKLKTMTEVLKDAKKFVEEHSSKLSKPLAPNMQYYLAHRAKYSQTHSDLNMQQLQSKLLHKFEKLSEEKKKKYVDKYEDEMKAFKEKKDKMKKAEVPPRPPMNPMKLYLEDMYKKNPEKSKNDIYSEHKVKWYALNEQVRFKYINTALHMWKAYREELAAYCETYPNYQSNHKIFLGGSDRQIINKILGKPVKPPMSGYMLFGKDKHDHFLQYPFAERSTRISAEWKALPEAEREKYINQWKELDEIYKKDLKKFKEDHPELEEELKPKKAKSQKKKSEATKEKSSEPELDVIKDRDD